MVIGWFFNRDKTSLDVFWLRYESLEESDHLPNLALEIAVLRLAPLGTTSNLAVDGVGGEDMETVLE